MRRLHPARACTLLGLALLASSSPAQAQQTPASASPGVTQQSAAQHSWSLAAALFAEGTKLFQQWRFDEAEQKFRNALTHREHPIIHLYLSRALEKQGRLVEAHEALRPVLRPSVEPLPSEDVQVAKELQKSLESRLAEIEVHCTVPGAEVSLDGEPWFTAPGQRHRMMNAGQHVLIARKPGYFPIAEPVSLLPGKQARVVLRMTADVIHIERRWQSAMPWRIAAAGAVTSLLGGALVAQARSDYAAYERAFAPCEDAPSCNPVSSRRRDSGSWKEVLGTGALLVGGAGVAVGLVGVLLNQPRSYRSEPADGVQIELAPLVPGDSTGISARIQF